MADDGLTVLTGDLVVPGEAHIGEDEYESCPVAGAAEPWLQEALRARRLMADGVALADITERPSAAFLDALALLSVEADVWQRVEMEAAQRRAEANAGQGAR